ncbi:hypothetical protein [Spirosoma pollinicola]|uniref:Uncharacterized protein n=1 Tax=Spirosoma pollinicola TaxID=2057025 RepID=A0A2K8YXR2_9BACT|nr:hypothetical protein [Spirosoma pollinicola]AUD02389.1 hypothetical protein CWM47_11465 [Spirosoma pollinicola]
MAIPCLDIQHLKTSHQNEPSGLINRYWFQWKNRRQLGNVTVRLDLLDVKGKILVTSRTKLPKVAVTDYIPATATEPALPIYAGSTLISIDEPASDEKPTSFRYTTESGAFKKSDLATGPLDGIYEDLSMNS